MSRSGSKPLSRWSTPFGGLQVYVPQTIDYRNVDGGGDSVLYEGWQTLDGAATEFFLRARKTYGDSDITRLNTQRYFYAALFARLRSMTVWDIARMIPVFTTYMETDPQSFRYRQRRRQHAQRRQLQDHDGPGAGVYGAALL